jgi:hypothetical protein
VYLYRLETTGVGSEKTNSYLFSDINLGGRYGEGTCGKNSRRVQSSESRFVGRCHIATLILEMALKLWVVPDFRSVSSWVKAIMGKKL